MPGEDQEVRAQLGDVDRRVRHRLRAVDQHQRADLVRPGDDLAERVDRAEDVRLLGDRDELGALVDHRRQVGEVEPAVVGEPEPAQGRAGALAQLLPGQQVGVVLHLGDDDLVALPDGVPPELRLLRRRGVGQRVGDEVDALGAVAGEDDLPLRRTDERADGGAGGLVGAGRLLGELVGSPVRRGVDVLVEPALGVEHLARLLRGGPGVEVDQPLPVPHGAGQDREVRPDRLDVQGQRRARPVGTRDGLRSCRSRPPRRPSRRWPARWSP